MMDWTDRHCRYFHRLLTKHALLYTEMVVADALVHGDAARHLDFGPQEHPVALQIGGSDPAKLAIAAQMGGDWGYDEVNLNVGCPSDRVQSGTFGACLMREPQLVARCVEAMKAVVDIPVTVKCRIGVDEQDTQKALDDLAESVWEAGCDGLWVHARKAWLHGLSPKENRDVPPLDYERVLRLKRDNKQRFIGINGGLLKAETVEGTDGVMLGRAAYQNPSVLQRVDRAFYNDAALPKTADEICDAMMAYTAANLARGGRVHHVTRHMIGLFQGQSGARKFRQILSVEASRPNADESVIANAFAVVRQPELKSA